MRKGIFISIAAAIITVLAACSIQKETPQTISTISQYTATPEAAVTSTVFTPTSTSTPESFETPDAFQFAAAKFSSQCKQISEADSLISPSGNWLATNCEGLEIVSMDGKRIVVSLPIQNDRSTIDEGEMDFPKYVPIHWSNNENYLYFSYIIWGGPCGGVGGTCSTMLKGHGYNGLYRYNLNTGEISTILNNGIRNFAFSPNGKTLAYISNKKNTILLDLVTGKNSTIFSDGFGSVDLTWSPDGNLLAFATCYTSPPKDWLIDHSTISVYSQKKILTVLIKPSTELHVSMWKNNQEFIVKEKEITLLEIAETIQTITIPENISELLNFTITPTTK